MISHVSGFFVLSLLLFVARVDAHLACFAKGMYCRNGPQANEDLNSYAIVNPLYQLPFDQWWMHHVNNCDNYPPPAGEFLDLPAGGSVTVELASNRAKTTLSYNGRDTSDWPDGAQYPEDYHTDHGCITTPNMHAENRSMAAGTAFAISYTSDIKAVKPDNLAVFSVLEHSPWKRRSTYQVPAAMPACPKDGCICAWGWVPNGCGIPNMYMQPFRCRVTGATSTTPVAPAQPPKWCEGNPNECVKGAKQMIYWNQLTGNNIEVSGWDLSGRPKSPGYNMKLGFAPGAQNDIFGGTPSTPSSPSPSASASGSGSGSGNVPSPSSSSPSSSGTGYGNGGGNGGGGESGAPPSPSSPGITTPSKNGTNTPSTAKKCRHRPTVSGRSALVKKSILHEGLSSHLKRQHARQLF